MLSFDEKYELKLNLSGAFVFCCDNSVVNALHLIIYGYLKSDIDSCWRFGAISCHLNLILKSERIESDIQIELADPSTLTVKLISVIPGSKREIS